MGRNDDHHVAAQPATSTCRLQSRECLDRTSIHAALEIVFTFKAAFSRHMFIVVALTYSFVSWHILLLAGRVDVLTAAYDDFQGEQVLRRWLPLKFKKHGSRVTQSLGTLVACNRPIVGLVRF